MLRHPSCDKRLRAFSRIAKRIMHWDIDGNRTYIIRSGSILYSISRTFFLHKIWSRSTQNQR